MWFYSVSSRQVQRSSSTWCGAVADRTRSFRVFEMRVRRQEHLSIRATIICSGSTAIPRWPGSPLQDLCTEAKRFSCATKFNWPATTGCMKLRVPFAAASGKGRGAGAMGHTLHDGALLSAQAARGWLCARGGRGCPVATASVCGFIWRPRPSCQLFERSGDGEMRMFRALGRRQPLGNGSTGLLALPLRCDGRTEHVCSTEGHRREKGLAHVSARAHAALTIPREVEMQRTNHGGPGCSRHIATTSPSLAW